MTRLWVTGEALIDFVPEGSGADLRFRPCNGGSSYNVAKAAARQGADVAFLGAISTDLFGARLAAELAAEGVDLAHAARVAHPTTLAFVEFDGANARYAFFNNDTATRLTDHGHTAAQIRPGDIIHTGSIGLIEDPGGANIEAYVLDHARSATLLVDPNARPSMTPDVAAWRGRIERLIAQAGIVKMSDEDLAVVAPGQSPEAYAAGLVAAGVSLVVITLGPAGAMAMTPSADVRVRARTEGIVDTVGAGDTVTGTLLAEILAQDLARPRLLAALGPDRLGALLDRAMVAAWLNCRAPGCNPPTRQATDRMVEAEDTSVRHPA